jgi:hypothetical protein
VNLEFPGDPGACGLGLCFGMRSAVQRQVDGPYKHYNSMTESLFLVL